MSNTAKFTCRVDYDGACFLIWQGNVLLMTTTKPADLVAACRGRIKAPEAKATTEPKFETTEEFLARGGKIKRVKATPFGFDFSEDDIAAAVSQVHAPATPGAVKATEQTPSAQPSSLDISDNLS